MATEIERKFLVEADKLPRELPAGEEFEQGYLSTEPTVRVRLVDRERGYLTIKGPGFLQRSEFEYPIPAADAVELLQLCLRRLHKVRRRLGPFELDWFPALKLWLAEIELNDPDEPFARPAWLGREVTGDPAYSNSRLASPDRAE